MAVPDTDSTLWQTGSKQPRPAPLDPYSFKKIWIHAPISQDTKKTTTHNYGANARDDGDGDAD